MRKLKKHRLLDSYEFTGFGFPVILKKVVMVTDGDYEYPRIDIERLRPKVSLKLARSNKVITGSQLHYIRQFLDLTTRDLAQKLGVTHVSIVKWEGKRDEKTNMSYASEILLKSLLLLTLEKGKDRFERSYLKILAFDGLEPPSPRLEM